MSASAILPEERGLYKKMKVLEQLVFFGELHGLSKEKRASVPWTGPSVLRLTTCSARRTEELSKGMQQKIQFIGSLLHDPGLIVMDEPFSGLDPVNAKLLEQTLLELKDQGKAIVFSTHRMDQVEKLCDSICLINNGEAVLAGRMREIKSRYERNHVVVEFEGSAAFLNSAEIAEAKNFSGHAEIQAEAAWQRAKAAAGGFGRGDHLPLRAGGTVARRDLHPDRGRQGRCVTCF